MGMQVDPMSQALINEASARDENATVIDRHNKKRQDQLADNQRIAPDQEATKEKAETKTPDPVDTFTRSKPAETTEAKVDAK